MPKLSYASTKQKDILYLVKMEIGDDFFILENEKETFVFIDSREFEMFKEKNTNRKLKPVLLDPLLQEVQTIPGKTNRENKLAELIIKKFAKVKEFEVPNYFPLDMADYLRRKGIILTVANPFRPERLIKTKEEVRAIKDAIQKTTKAFRKIEEILKDTKIKNKHLLYKGERLTSEFLKQTVDELLFAEGLLNIEGSIISSGPHAAIPHHPGSGPIKAGETIICDLFPISRDSHYFADMTRTFAKGKPNEKIQRMYDAVLKAQEKAFAKIKPGVKAKDIHNAVAQSFIEDGFDVGEKGFTHSTGHGLGLDLHELPYISKNSEEVLEVGHVFTVEPGLYYRDTGGVRIEDVVLVTKGGYDNLTHYPKKFLI
jgi:Xaa-Pro aminopeptidase